MSGYCCLNFIWFPIFFFLLLLCLVFVFILFSFYYSHLKWIQSESNVDPRGFCESVLFLACIYYDYPIWATIYLKFRIEIRMKRPNKKPYAACVLCFSPMYFRKFSESLFLCVSFPSFHLFNWICLWLFHALVFPHLKSLMYAIYCYFICFMCLTVLGIISVPVPVPVTVLTTLLWEKYSKQTHTKRTWDMRTNQQKERYKQTAARTKNLKVKRFRFTCIKRFLVLHEPLSPHMYSNEHVFITYTRHITT